MTDPALVWGVVGGVAGVIGTITGVIGVVVALKANSKSAIANDLSETANKLAGGSNTIALDARKIALEANEYSHRAEKRETERHDVYWDGGWRQPSKGVYQLIKRGGDGAHNIKATVVVDREELSETSELLTEDGAAILFRFPAAAREFQRRQKEIRDAPLIPHMGVKTVPPKRTIKVRVEWNTSLGTPRVYQDETSKFY